MHRVQFALAAALGGTLAISATAAPPPVPKVRDTVWVRNPIDAFILAQLEARGLSPSLRAEPRVLIQRLTRGLGMPLNSKMYAYLKNPSRQAYDRLIDECPDIDPHRGFRRGRMPPWHAQLIWATLFVGPLEPELHTDLIDWLNAEMEKGISFYEMQKLIMKSNTWQMTTTETNLPAIRADPDNKLFWRQNPGRLRAHIVRRNIRLIANLPSFDGPVNPPNDAAINATVTRLLTKAGKHPEQQIAHLYHLALGRAPRVDETKAALRVLGADKQATSTKTVTTKGHLLDGWNYFAGDWAMRSDGGYEVKPAPGAKAIWKKAQIRNGTVECEVMLVKPGGDLGLVVRVTDPRPGVNSLFCYNINFLANRVRLGTHKNNWKELVSVPASLPVGKWHQVHVELKGSRVRIAVNGAELVNFNDLSPLTDGRVGFRTYFCHGAFRNLKVTSGKDTWTALTADSPERRAIARKDSNDPKAHPGLRKLVAQMFESEEFLTIQ